MLKWSSLKVFECPAVGTLGEGISIHKEPLDWPTLPRTPLGRDDGTKPTWSPFDCLTSPQRFERGDSVVICGEADSVMGYIWLSFKDLWVSEARLFMKVSDAEAVTYDAFVFPPYRGRGLHARLGTAALAEAGRRGRTRVISYVESDNSHSLKTQLRLGKTHVMSLYSIHVLSRYSLHWASGRPLASGFYR